MNPCCFNQLHDTWNKDICTIADGIDFHFHTLDVFIDQYWLILIDFYCRCQIFNQFFIMVNAFSEETTVASG